MYSPTQPLEFKTPAVSSEIALHFHGENMMQFQWEQRGGRLKLVEDDAVRSVAEEG